MESSVTIDEVRRRIESALPGARVRVATFEGGDHFEAVVEAPQFAGRSRIEQHRMVYAALDGLLGGAMHALALRTSPLDPSASS
jgi:stress-induced morphogen